MGHSLYLINKHSTQMSSWQMGQDVFLSFQLLAGILSHINLSYQPTTDNYQTKFTLLMIIGINKEGQKSIGCFQKWVISPPNNFDKQILRLKLTSPLVVVSPFSTCTIRIKWTCSSLCFNWFNVNNMSLDTDDVSSLVFSRSPITHDVVQSGRYVSQLPSFPELDIVFSEPHNA